MSEGVFAALRAEVARAVPVAEVGRVVAAGRGLVRVAGLPGAALGERVRIGAGPCGEIVALSSDGAEVLAEGAAEGIVLGAAVTRLGPASIAPHDGWIGRIVDAFGAPLDGRPLLRGGVARPLLGAPPPAAARRRLGARLDTGMAAFDTLLPLVRGQRIGLFAGSGVGKSMLLSALARGVEADVVVIALIGERGRELREFVEETLGPEGMARAVVVAATSEQPPLVRRRAAWAAMAAAEHFRDRGHHVLLLADSLTRFAEAHREVALAAGEGAALGGYPPSTAHHLMHLAERAGPGVGPGAGTGGDITAVFSVLVAGSDMEGPVADIVRGVLDGHVVLDRAIAERGRYPAIDLVRSVSRSLPGAASAAERALIDEARRLLGAHAQAEMMIRAGLYQAGSDPLLDRAVDRFAALDAFLAMPSPGRAADSFALLADCLARPAPTSAAGASAD